MGRISRRLVLYVGLVFVPLPRPQPQVIQRFPLAALVLVAAVVSACGEQASLRNSAASPTMQWADSACDRFAMSATTERDVGTKSFDRFIRHWDALVRELDEGARQHGSPAARQLVETFRDFHDAMKAYRESDAKHAVEARDGMLQAGIVAFRAADEGGFENYAALIGGESEGSPDAEGQSRQLAQDSSS
jgi:hypothetical protein